MYIAYDIKGIQQFIFSVPKLKYIVGGSLLIADLDKQIKEKFHKETIFAGGGHGILECSESETDHLKQALIDLAQDYGLDLRIGINKSFSDAVVGAEDLYPFLPDSLEGEPCRISGLWPITYEKSCGYTSESKGIHPKIWERRKKLGKSNNSFDGQIIRELINQNDFPDELKKCFSLEFLTTVKADQETDDEEMQQRAELGSSALGDRNRWAIVALDGNDMGSQFRAFEDASVGKDEMYKRKWYKTMSIALDECTRGAFYHALAEVISKWWEEEGQWIYLDPSNESCVVLPFRPLILGGDDVLCLSHPGYAMDLAKSIIEKFAKLSEQKAKEAKPEGIDELWPGTSNELSISAGIVYTSVNQPLHMAIPYAESLLGSAKGKFRNKRQAADGTALKKPTPAAIDWENITETMIDTPTARRHRDLTFIDEDLGGLEVQLTKRPYQVKDDLGQLIKLKEQLSHYPKSLLAQCQEILRLPWAKRMQRLAAMRKQKSDLVDMIKDRDLDGNLGSYWEEERECPESGVFKRVTSFLDAVMLLEEEHRMEQNTAN